MRGHFQNRSCNSSKAKRSICNFFSRPTRAKRIVCGLVRPETWVTPAGLEPATNSLEGYEETL
jgi:hypothetical protein